MADQEDPYANLISDPYDQFATTGVGQDIGKVSGPALLKGGVGLATTVPTLADLAVSGGNWAAGKVLSPENAQAVSGWSDVAHRALDPVTYGGVMKRIEAQTGPLYEAQTTPGKYFETTAEVMPSAAALGPGSLAAKVGRGIGAGVGSETGKELAEKYLPSWAVPYATIFGGIAGGAGGPAALRKTVTPFPAAAPVFTIEYPSHNLATPPLAIVIPLVDALQI